VCFTKPTYLPHIATVLVASAAAAAAVVMALAVAMAGAMDIYSWSPGMGGLESEKV